MATEMKGNVQIVRIDRTFESYEFAKFKQGSTWNKLIIYVTDQGLPYNLETNENIIYRLQGATPDNRFIFRDATSVHDNVVEFDSLNEYFTCMYGECRNVCLSIWENSDVKLDVLLEDITIKIEKNSFYTSNVINSDQLSTLNKLILKADEKINECINATEFCIQATNECIESTELSKQQNIEFKADEDIRKASELERISDEDIRKASENNRISKETQRINDEAIRQAQESTRQTDTQMAITNCNQVTTTCENLIDEVQQKLDNNEFDGFSPKVTLNPSNTSISYKLDITTKDGLFTTPNLKGQDGTGGDMYKNTYDSTGRNTDIFVELDKKLNASDTPTSLPANGGNADTVDNKHASDFATSNHTHSKADIGLGNVDNTKDTDKSVKYATSAGSASNSTKVGGYSVSVVTVLPDSPDANTIYFVKG